MKALGIAKTHEPWPGFHPCSPGPERVRASRPLAQHEVFVTAAPKWMSASGVLGKLHPYGPDRFPGIEEALSLAFNGMTRLQEYTQDYGMFNYGDIHSNWLFECRE